MTRKHKMAKNDESETNSIPQQNSYECSCGRVYSINQGRKLYSMCKYKVDISKDFLMDKSK